MNNFSVEEVEHICLRSTHSTNSTNSEEVKKFLTVFKYYKEHNNKKKLQALTKIFNQCFWVEKLWSYDELEDKSWIYGYDIRAIDYSELISNVIEKQYQKVIKLIFEEENTDLELQESINELEN